MSKGIGGHHRAYRGKNDEWITPKYIIDALGPFQLDPCAADCPPWYCAIANVPKCSDGLSMEWEGRVWLNPPYGPETGKWLKKLADHADGIALVFARTETKFFQEEVFDKADAIFFLKGRLTFYYPCGLKAPHNSGGPSCLVAYGDHNALCLETCGLPGYCVLLNKDRDDEF